MLDVVQMGRNYRRAGLWGRLSGAGAHGKLWAVWSALAWRNSPAVRSANFRAGSSSGSSLPALWRKRAELYLLDEPFAGVDAATEHAIMDVLRGLRAEGKFGHCRASRPCHGGGLFRPCLPD